MCMSHVAHSNSKMDTLWHWIRSIRPTSQNQDPTISKSRNGQGSSLNSATTFASMNTLHCHDVGTKNTVILCIYTSRSTSGAVWSVVKRRGRCPRTPVGAVGLRPTGITMPAPKKGMAADDLDQPKQDTCKYLIDGNLKTQAGALGSLGPLLHVYCRTATLWVRLGLISYQYGPLGWHTALTA